MRPIIIANDGLVPIQSALFLNINNGERFATKDFTSVKLVENNIDKNSQVKDYRIYTKFGEQEIENHSDLLNPQYEPYWQQLREDIVGFLPDGVPEDVIGEFPEGNIFEQTPVFKWSEYGCLDGTLQKGYQVRVWDDTDGDVVYDTGLILDASANSHVYNPSAYEGEDKYAFDGIKRSESLEMNHNYHWHVRYMSEVGKWSAWANYPPSDSEYIRFSLKPLPWVNDLEVTFSPDIDDKEYIKLFEIENENDVAITFDADWVDQYEIENYKDLYYKVKFKTLSENELETDRICNIKLDFGEKYNNHSISIVATQKGVAKYLIASNVDIAHDKTEVAYSIVKTNLDSWEVELLSGHDWLIIENDISGSRVSLRPNSKNTSTQLRSAELLFSADGVDDVKAVVTQDARPVILYFEEPVELENSKAAKKFVEITANMDWDYELISGSEWLSAERTEVGLNLVSGSQNDSQFDRYAKIRVFGDGVEKELHVSQKGREAYLQVSTDRILFTKDVGTTKTFEIESNIDWEITFPDWIGVNIIKGAGDYIIEAKLLNVTENEQSRFIIVSNSDFPDLEKKIEVKQSSTPILSIQDQEELLEENSPNGLEVLLLNVENPTSAMLKYSLLDSNSPFAVDNSGILTVVNSEELDYEKNREFRFTVRVEEEANPSNYDESLITIKLKNLNDCSPKFVTKSLKIAKTTIEYTEYIQVLDEDILAEDKSEITVVGTLPDWLTFESFETYAKISGLPLKENAGETLVTFKVTDGNEEDIVQLAIIVIHENHSPNIPQLSLPIDNELSTSITPILKWSCTDPDGDDPLNYIVFLDKGDGSGLVEIGTTNIPTYDFTGFELLNEINYSWAIVANDGELDSEQSEVWSFTTEKLDDVNPVLTLSSVEKNPTSSTIFNLTITSSEEITGFELSDLILTNCTASNLQTTNNIDFTFDIEPSNDGVLTLNISENTLVDLAGNGNAMSNEFSITYDGTAPRVEFSFVGNSITSLDALVVEIVFTEEITGFELADIGFDNCSIDNLKTSNNIDYSVDVNPIGIGLITLDLEENKLLDLAGNGNLKADQWSISVTGIESLQTLGLKLYPNPIKNDLTISSSVTNTVMVQVLSAGGEVVFSEEWESPFTKRINFSNYSNGLYLVRFRIDGKVVTHKIMLVK